VSAPQPAGVTSLEAAVAAASARLAASGVEEPRREAHMLLALALGQTRAFVLAHGADALDAADGQIYRALAARRALREPFAYLSGERSWLDFALAVDRNVLIPRPETELLAQAAIAGALHLGREGEPPRAAPVVVDVGTGSGAIALAVARACPGAMVFGTDSSGGALRMAARNVARLAPGRVQLLACEQLAGVPLPAHVIVANLPYIPSADLAALAPELAFEPRSALDGGPDGLAVIRALLAQAPAHLARTGALLLLECGHDQAARVAALALACLPTAHVELHADLAGIVRFVHARVPAW
jgi:release factor glutamine methyltransferase